MTPVEDIPEGAASEPTADLARKVTAILLRDNSEGDRELLVFRHPDMDGSGPTIQLPAGTVEDGEDERTAVLRELAEETGVTTAEVVDLLAFFDEPGRVRDAIHGQPPHHRQIFHLRPTTPLDDHWLSTCDCGAPLECFWLPLTTAQLHPHQQPWLDAARTALARPASPRTSDATEISDTSDECPSSPLIVSKATAVVTRGSGPLRELLVFEHARTGLQLPAGTVEQGETFEAAAIRELAEETGITNATLHAELGHLDDLWAPDKPFHRHIFHFEPTTPTEERWQRPCDCGDQITLYWLPLASARLDHHQQPWLDLARAALDS